MSDWVVEPNVLGGWDVRPADSTNRRSRHASRSDAVADARQAGGKVVVVGTRGEVLERFDGLDARTREPRGTRAPRAPHAPRNGMRLGQMLNLTDQTDETGRLLLEDSAPPQAVRKAERAGISMQTEPAPYQDTPSRLGGQMNAAAYDALRRDTADILSGFSWLAYHRARRAPGEAGTPRRLYGVSYMGVSLVHVLFHRATNPVPPYGRLPSFVASIFKASRGIFSFSVQMENDLGPDVMMSADEVVRYAEEKHQLVRPQTGRVCAAPTRLIERTLAVILGDSDDEPESAVASLLDVDALWQFYEQQDALGELLSRFGPTFSNMTRMAPGAEPNRLFKMVIPAGPAKGQTLGDFTQATLQQVNAVQAGLNAALGRTDATKAITLDELARLL